MQEKNFKTDLQRLRTNRRFLAVLILLFISIFFWIIINLITSQSKEVVSKELTTLAKPLVPNIDKSILTKLKAKRAYTDNELSSFIIYKILTTKDGKTEKVVPLNVTLDDIDPKPTIKPVTKTGGLGSLLQENTENASESAKVQR